MATRASSLLARVLGGDELGGEGASPAARLCRLAVSVLEMTGAGVAVMNAEGKHAGTVAVSDEPSAALEELQFALGEGPCVDASRNRRPELQSDLLRTGSSRWPVYGPAVADRGVRAVFSFPLQVGGIRLGVLDLFRDAAGSLSNLGLAEALTFSDVATQVLLYMQDDAARRGGPWALTQAMENRAVIHQATGRISVQLGASLTDALLRLRAHAYAEQRSVSDVARDVVTQRLRFDNGIEGVREVIR